MEIVCYNVYEFNSFEKKETLVATFFDQERMEDYVADLNERGYYELFFHHANVFADGTEVKILD